MIVDRTLIEEYPFDGEFYEKTIDTSLPPSQQVETEVVLLSTKCDIQESQKTENDGATNAKFNVYYPFDKEEGVNIKRGVSFRGSMYGVKVEGKVIGVFPTQLGGCGCYIGDMSV